MNTNCLLRVISFAILIEFVHNLEAISKTNHVRIVKARKIIQRNSTPHFTPTLRKPTKQPPTLLNFTSSVYQNSTRNSTKRISNKKCLINFCKNKGECFGSISSYYCSCEPGYTGPSCEIVLCDAKFCRSRGVCKLDSNSKRQCECFESYYGEQCENASLPKWATERFKNRFVPTYRRTANSTFPFK
jgi:hypothetical protein